MIRKGILKAFDSNTYKASVQVIGSLSVWLDNVAVSAALNSADLVVGRSIVLLSLDPSNPDDCILVGLWGVPQEPPAPGAHENTHTDGASDEIDSALDPRAYPMLAGTLAARPAAGVEGRFYWTTDEHILYRDNEASWVKVAVADHADLDGIGANDHHNQVHDLAGDDHNADSYASLNSKVSDATLEKQENRGQASGYCDLDASALVPLARIPATLTGKDADTVDGEHKADLESTMDSKISTHAAVAGAHHPAVHGLGSGYHGSATFAELNSKVSDATLLKQGDTLTGNLGANPGVSVDGVDISAHAADASAHHTKTGDNEVYGLILCDILANRPSAGTANRFFWATDEHILYRDTGSAWVKAAVADHADLDGIGASDHHAKYTDAEAKAACVSDTPYDGTGWNGVTDVAPSKNAVRDELEGHYAAADPHTGYVKESEFTAENGSLWGTGGGTLAEKTPAEVLAILSGQAAADFSMNTHKITSIVDPVDDQDAATKKYVDDNAGGGSGDEIKDSDADTKVQVEESPDEDMIRMDVAGVEAFHLDANGILTLAKQAGFGAYPSTNQPVPDCAGNNGAYVCINTEAFDVQSEFNSTVKTGTADATEANKLHDADGGFAASDVGAQVWNTTDNTYALVTAFVDSGELTLDANIMVNGEGYKLYHCKYTASVAGKYVIAGCVHYLWSTVSADKNHWGILNKNGAMLTGACLHAAAANYGLSCFFAQVVELAANDYLQLRSVHYRGSNSTVRSGSLYTFLYAFKIG